MITVNKKAYFEKIDFFINRYIYVIIFFVINYNVYKTGEFF